MFGNINAVKTIEPPDSHFLSAADGWLELGNGAEALAELDRISPSQRSHPEVLKIRFSVHSALGQWDSAAETSASLLELFPSDPQIWIYVAYATRRKSGGGIEQAKDILLTAQQRFPKEPIIAYNLACYECQLNRFEQASLWFAKALEVGVPSDIRKMAREDPDLKPLLPTLGLAKSV